MFWCIFFTIAIILCASVADLNDKGNCSFGLFGGVIIVVLVLIAMEEQSPSLKPIDVYRGKTTLEITYRDSIAIDSTVVWKEK